MVPAWSFVVMPLPRSHGGIAVQAADPMISVFPNNPASLSASPPTAARSNERTASLGRTGELSEYSKPGRRRNVHVRPPSRAAGMSVARSGTSVKPSGPPTRRYVTKASSSRPDLQGLRVTPHTFRHTTAMHLLQSGVELNVIRCWLGHVSIATTNRYIEIDLAMKAKALDTCTVGSTATTEPSWHSSPDILKWLESL